MEQSRNASETKKDLRRAFSVLRASLEEGKRARIDGAIARNVISLLRFQEADTVFSYLSVGEEVDTRIIIEEAWRLGKTVAIPRCTGKREMRWFAIENFDGLETSAFGIDEPPLDESRELHPSAHKGAIALVPALSFDPQGYRLGYGGGYYDVFLAAFAGVSIGMCRECQKSNSSLPHEPHDIPVDLVVSEAKCLVIR